MLPTWIMPTNSVSSSPRPTWDAIRGSVVVLAGVVAFAAGCSSSPDCVSNDSALCAEDLAAFPFARTAAVISDYCGILQCSGATPPAGATTMTMTHPEAGKLCMSGSIKPGGFALIGLEFAAKNRDETKVLKPFDAAALGITQVALTIDSPPTQGVDLLANAITHNECAANPVDCEYPPNFKFMTVSAPGPVVAPFAAFKSLDDPAETIDPSVLNAVFLQVYSGAFDFCFHDFALLDAAGAAVRP
jgi:hypothetical protein